MGAIAAPVVAPASDAQPAAGLVLQLERLPVELGLAARLGVPGCATRARCQGGKEGPQTGRATALVKQRRAPGCLAEPLALQRLACQTGRTGQPEGVVTPLIPQRFGAAAPSKTAAVPGPPLSRQGGGRPTSTSLPVTMRRA